ncbi:MAG TPA: SDR family oxidoreductase [Polyangiaceae bacterium]|jgi:NAD(P)-dependent dehydrogenase (short-subunit alcohol dehydrogenase family)|nr:SDR family oxidoreductase [Polyangiaceae bacterium]
MTDLRDKVVAVTGAASGIGRALAIDLVGRGAHVALSDVDEKGLAQTVESCASKSASKSGGRLKVTQHKVDVRDRAAVERYAAEVEAQHGGADAIINNAGITVRDSIEHMSHESFARVIDVNFWGVVYGTKAFFPLLRKRPSGHIVNISSINAMVPFTKNGPYNASKYAVLGFSETLMQELRGEPIKVTCVHPGGIRTNIARNGEGYSAAEAAAFDKIAMTSAEGAARTILDGMEHNRERVYVGLDSKFMAAAKRLVPASTVHVAGRASEDRGLLSFGRKRKRGSA